MLSKITSITKIYKTCKEIRKYKSYSEKKKVIQSSVETVFPDIGFNKDFKLAITYTGKELKETMFKELMK